MRTALDVSWDHRYEPVSVAVTAGRMDCVARLRELADELSREPDLEIRVYSPSALRDAANVLEREILEAGK